MEFTYIYLGVLLSAFLISLALVPIAKKLAWKFNILDKPLGEGHKLHSNATPVLGGAAMLSAWTLLIGLGLFLVATQPSLFGEQFANLTEGVNKRLSQLIVICACAVGYGLLGFWDDCKPMSAKFKLFLQILLALISAIWGVRLTLFASNPIITTTLTFCWLMFILNAFNFFDNMDGLATGVAAIAAIMFMIVAGLNGQYLVASFAAATAGVTIGFYFYNCNPASIFMGDSGSHFLGYLLGVMSTLVTYYSPESGTNPVYPFLIPILILAVVIFDLFAVVVIRLRINKPIYIGDHNHISHRFVKMGYSRRCAVLLVHLLCLILGLCAIAVMFAKPLVASIICVQMIALFLFLTLLHSRQDKEESK